MGGKGHLSGKVYAGIQGAVRGMPPTGRSAPPRSPTQGRGFRAAAGAPPPELTLKSWKRQKQLFPLGFLNIK